LVVHGSCRDDGTSRGLAHWTPAWAGAVIARRRGEDLVVGVEFEDARQFGLSVRVRLTS
jgi:hypothetical protein